MQVLWRPVLRTLSAGAHSQPKPGAGHPGWRRVRISPLEGKDGQFSLLTVAHIATLALFWGLPQSCPAASPSCLSPTEDSREGGS